MQNLRTYQIRGKASTQAHVTALQADPMVARVVQLSEDTIQVQHNSRDLPARLQDATLGQCVIEERQKLLPKATEIALKRLLAEKLRSPKFVKDLRGDFFDEFPDCSSSADQVESRLLELISGLLSR